MSIRNLNWYNLQATRRYPLDDSCTGETDDGRSFLNDVIVDCHVRFNTALGAHAYIQAATVSAGLVTVVFGVSDTLNGVGKSVAAVTIPRPININVNYALTPLVDGVAGWVVFGAGVNSPAFSARFSTPRQSLLSQRCARAYAPLPISTIGKLNVAPPLQNVVNILAESPIKLDYKKETIDGEEKQLVIFSLNKSDSSLSYNPLEYFLGTCAQRPENNNCGKTPISTINGVAPDCFGNIKINFENIGAEKFADCGGIDLVTDYGLKQACEGAPPLPLFYSDLCCPQRFDTLADRDAASITEFEIGEIVRVGVAGGASTTNYAYYSVESLSGGVVTWSAQLADTDPLLRAALAKCDWPDPTTVIPDVVINLPLQEDYPLVAFPVCVDFCSCDPEPPLFLPVQGVFSGNRVLAPFGCVPCGIAAAPETQSGLFALSPRNTYRAVDGGGTAIALFKTAATDWAFGKAIAAQIMIEPDGLDRNGGVVINYRQVVTNGITQNKYFVAAVDVSRGQFRLLDYTNNNYSVVASVPFSVQTGKWYKVVVYPTISGDYVNLYCAAEEMKLNGLRAEIIDYRVPLANYEPQTGAFGLYAERSYTNFNAFTVT